MLVYGYRSSLRPGSQSGDNAVSIDKSLKRGSRLSRPRNVMSRDERITILRDEDRWDETKSVLGLPKTKVPKLTIGKKKKKKTAEEDTEEA